VRSGDTLATIAEANGTTVERLLELNPGIDPVALPVGARVRVP
jgi:LysM repeat protein